MHKYARLPIEWRPTTVVAMEGEMSASPMMQVAAYEDGIAECWEAQSSPDVEVFRLLAETGGDDVPRSHLPLAQPDEIDQAAKDFKYETGIACDGFHRGVWPLSRPRASWRWPSFSASLKCWRRCRSS